MQVTITSAQELTTKQLDALKKVLTKKFHANLEYQQKVDPSVIGGIKVTVGSHEIDATVHNKLQQLRQQLLENQ